MMAKIRKFLWVVVGLGLTLGHASCGGDQGFSLARSGQTQDLSECLALIKKKKHEKGIKCLEAYKSRHFGDSSAALADLAMADAYFDKKDWLVAAEAYNLFIESNPSHPKVAYAYLRSGMSYLKETPKAVDRDQDNLDNALKALAAVVDYYSFTPYAQEAKRHQDQARLKVAQKDFYVGRYYYKNREYLSAIPRFEEIVREYPLLGLDEKSFYYLICSLKKVEQTETALRYFDVFKQHFPDSVYIKRIAGIF
jgi:outer membrane protein assembly factor BamD